MDSYEGNLDLSLLEELTETEAREYLIGKYGHDYAERVLQIMKFKLKNEPRS